MIETAGITLSLDEGARRRAGALVPRPALVLAQECGRPQASSARYSLAGLSVVNLGRGSERRTERVAIGESGAPELTIRVPDRWMSSRHARLEHSFGRWVLTDTDSKNGVVVNSAITRRVVLANRDLVELGHTLFVFYQGLLLGENDPLDVDLAQVPDDIPGLTTLDPDLERELVKLRQVAPSTIPVLLEGESGTGKEVLARAVHTLSGRTGEFVAVNCGAISPNLVESELFGHKKGAFSGAQDDRKGLVRSADGGTLFLDEIGDLPAASQAALLRVLQEREVLPVGGTKPVAIDLRVIAATHRDLDSLVGSGAFRHDLFARLAGFRMTAPPLRDRTVDLGLLISVLQRKLAGPDHPGFEIDALRLLFRHEWPLNVRELEQALATANVLAGPDPISSEDLPEPVRGSTMVGGQAPAALSDEDQRVRDQLVAALREHHGNISAVARAMNKDRKQIQRWVKRFSLDIGDYR